MHRSRYHIPLAGLTAAFLAAPLAASSGPMTGPEPAPAGQEGKSRRSLEDILKEVRSESGRAASALHPEVVRIVADIDKLKNPRTGPRSKAMVEQLEALGPAALPLLVPFLEPGEDLSRQTVFRSELICQFLRESPTATTTDALLELASTGSAQGRLGALVALESTPEPKRAAPILVSIARSERTKGLSPDSKQSVVNAAFCALAHLDDQGAREFIAESVLSKQADLCAGALIALSDAPAHTSAPQMLLFLASMEDAKLVASAVADYYEKNDALLEDVDHARALGSIATHTTTPTEPRIRMFDTLRVTDAKIGTPTKRAVEPYVQASRPDLRLAAQMLLARHKDRGAKQDLFHRLDNLVKKDKKSISAHSERATMYHAIGDWNAAERDWRIVMKQIANDEIGRARKEPYIGIARALARLRKFREASSYLSQGPLSVEELQGLGLQRDFREMRESRFGDVFQ